LRVTTAALPDDGSRVVRTYAHLSMVAVEATATARQRLEASPGVASVVPDRRLMADADQGPAAVIDDAATLVFLANYNMVTAHVWLSRVQAPEQPDQLIFDLDPSDDDFNLVRETALTLKGLLDDVHLVPFVKTTGSRGLHVVVPIRATGGFEAAHVFADAVAQRLAATDPAHVTTEFIKQKREGRLFIDVNRNAYAQTAVAPYAVRARRGAPVSVPIPWSEVERESLRPDSLTIKNLFDYLDDNPDPWQQMEGSRQSLPVLSASDRPDRSGRRRGVARAPGADASS